MTKWHTLFLLVIIGIGSWWLLTYGKAIVVEAKTNNANFRLCKETTYFYVTARGSKQRIVDCNNTTFLKNLNKETTMINVTHPQLREKMVVYYIPSHLEKTLENAERGVISTYSNRGIWVRYTDGETGALTDIKDLYV